MAYILTHGDQRLTEMMLTFKQLAQHATPAETELLTELLSLERKTVTKVPRPELDQLGIERGLYALPACDRYAAAKGIERPKRIHGWQLQKGVYRPHTVLEVGSHLRDPSELCPPNGETQYEMLVDPELTYVYDLRVCGLVYRYKRHNKPLPVRVVRATPDPMPDLYEQFDIFGAEKLKNALTN